MGLNNNQLELQFMNYEQLNLYIMFMQVLFDLILKLIEFSQFLSQLNSCLFSSITEFDFFNYCQVLFQFPSGVIVFYSENNFNDKEKEKISLSFIGNCSVRDRSMDNSNDGITLCLNLSSHVTNVSSVIFTVFIQPQFSLNDKKFHLLTNNFLQQLIFFLTSAFKNKT